MFRSVIATQTPFPRAVTKPQCCPICAESTHFSFTARDVPIFRCDYCGHRYADCESTEQHVFRVYNNDYFFGGGAGYRDYLSEADLLRRRGRRYGAILSRYAGLNRRVLDIGSAAGFIASGIQDLGFSVTALEPNECMARYASSVLGLQVLRGEIEALNEYSSFDVITMIQLISHLVDPRRALAVVARATRPGGYWLIEGWNSDSIMARFRGRRWHVYNPPSVLHYFSTKSLDRLAAEFSFMRVAVGRPTKLITAAHAASLLEFLKGSSLPMRMVEALARKLPGKLALPYPGDDIFWALYKKGETASHVRLPYDSIAARQV